MTRFDSKAYLYLYAAFLLILFSCSSTRQYRSSPDLFIDSLLHRYPQYFDSILPNADSFKIQIIYTRIDRTQKNKPILNHYRYNVDDNMYFYPASTVKLPIALLALEKLNGLNKPGIDKNTAMITEAAYGRQTAVYNDPSSADGKPSIAHYIKKIFLASDNDASNRLYEFLGQEYLNHSLRRKGYKSLHILHRLSISMSEDENRHTNPIKFLNDSGVVVYEQPSQVSGLHYPRGKIFMGQGYIEKNKRVDEPFDFSAKNRITLPDLHSILQAVMFPATVRKRQRFEISDEDRHFVMQFMSQYPSETLFPQFDSTALLDANGKLLLWGSEKQRLPKHIRIFNKVGGAYGFLTDVAYVVDFEKNIEFMLSATIYCNSDEIFNDDKYDYNTVGFPFMKHLGQVIYQYESTRSRRYPPDLTKFKMTYEK